MIELLYRDDDLIVCRKPPRVISADVPDGLPALLRAQLPGVDVRTVHRLDAVTGGLMALAANESAARALSAQIRAGGMEKEYRAVAHDAPLEPAGRLIDYLWRDRRAGKSCVVAPEHRPAQWAALRYETLAVQSGLRLLRVVLETGRTHQIRVQFAARGLPLVGDRKYGAGQDEACELALWSYRLAFRHPRTGDRLTFTDPPPRTPPWTAFDPIE